MDMKNTELQPLELQQIKEHLVIIRTFTLLPPTHMQTPSETDKWTAQAELNPNGWRAYSEGNFPQNPQDLPGSGVAEGVSLFIFLFCAVFTIQPKDLFSFPQRGCETRTSLSCLWELVKLRDIFLSQRAQEDFLILDTAGSQIPLPDLWWKGSSIWWDNPWQHKELN